MCHPFLRDARFWLVLLQIDRDIAASARRDRCPHCRGPLHSADYERKPRGVDSHLLSVELRYRLSFCCGQEGCRKRLTPPSARFLGRKVYLGAVVVLVTAMRHGPTPPGMRKLTRLFGADRRTISRWQEFWRDTFPSSAFWKIARARFMPPVDETRLPRSLIRRFEASALESKVRDALRFLAPITITGGLAMHAH